MNNKIYNVENPSKNLSKQLREVVFTLSLGGLISAGNPVNANTNTVTNLYGSMINNTLKTSSNINGKICYKQNDIIENQSKNKNVYSLPIYNNNSEIGLLTEGEIANADYEIYDNRGRYAYFGKTNSKGQIRINKDVLLSNLQFVGYDVQNLNNYNQVLTIKLKGGTINDKDGDFCTDKTIISNRGQYTITGTLNQLNNSTISRISTLVENIVNGNDYTNLRSYYTDIGLNPKNKSSITNINEIFINTIDRVKEGLITNYGLKNGNNDNIIDYNDISKFSDLQYSTQKSLETYANYIKNGDSFNTKNIVNIAKTKMNLVSIDYEKSGSNYLVLLDSYMQGKKIFYSYFANFANPVKYNIGQEIFLSEGQVLYFRENYIDINKSGTISKLEVKKGQLYRDGILISNINGLLTTSIGSSSKVILPTNQGNQTFNTPVPIVNNAPGSYTNMTTNNSSTIQTIDERIDKVIADIQKELSADNSSTNLQKLIDEIKIVEKEIEVLKSKSLQNNTTKTNLQNDVNQLNQKLSSLKQTITNTYNKLDNNAKVLLESTLGTNQKQDAVNSILSGTQTKTATVGTKTFDKLPNKAQIKVSLDLLNTKAVELTRDVNTLKQILDRLDGIYKTKQKEYQDSVNAYNQYQVDKSKYQQVLQKLSNGINPLNFSLKNLSLNVGFIANRSSVKSALSELNNRFNQFPYPESRKYQLDKFKKGLKDTGEKPFLSLLGYNSTISVDYGNNNSFPAIIQVKLSGSVLQSITVNNAQNAKDITDYMYKLVEKQIASKELSKLLSIENEKNEIAKRVLDNAGQYKQIKVLGQDFYRSAEIDYQKAKTNYDNIKSKYDFKNNLLNGYKNLISNYGTGIDNVNTTNAQVTEKTELVKAIEVSNKETFVALGGKEASKQQKQQAFSNGVKSLTSNFLTTYKTNPNTSNNTTQFADYPRCYVEMKNGYTPVYKNRNGDVFRGNQTVIDNNLYIKHPFTIYVRFNINGSGNDYPAEIWVEYKENARDEFSHPTETIKINSRKELDNRESIKMLVNKAKSDITLLRINKANDNSTKKDSPVTDNLNLTITDLVKKLDKQYNIQEKNFLARYISKYIKYKVEKIHLEVKFGLGFTNGYLNAIYDTAEYLESLTFLELKTIFRNILNILSDTTEYSLNISKYWETLISYTLNKTPTKLQQLNDLEKKLSFAPEIIYAKNILIGIDWNRFEDKSYWIGYYTGYLAENVLVSKGVGAGTSFATKLLKISNLSQKLKSAGVLGNLTNLDNVILLQDKLILGSKKWNVADIQTIANKTNNPLIIYTQFDNGEIYDIIKQGDNTLFLAKGNSATGFEHIFITGRGGTSNLTRYEQFYNTRDVKLNNWLKDNYGYEIDSPNNMMRFIRDVIYKNNKGTNSNGLYYGLNIDGKTIKVGYADNGYITTITY
ncbi:MAG: hypothetical protein Q8K30_05170 [Candidatus Gracilibacteria bacterium]|nr:hypothetical protein [Candidatus Gracilibacteria bacterium]